MSKYISICFLMFFLFCAKPGIAEVRIFELADGSTITGEVMSMTNGVYSIKSEVLGIIRLEESKIRAIRSATGPDRRDDGRADSGTGAGAGEVKTLQEKMMGDAEIMTLIQSLQNDPEFRHVLEDPGILNAVNAGDFAVLMANPRFMQLLNNATVKEIQNKVN